MPVMKPIACHSRSCYRSMDYAAGEDNPKVLARDSLNLADAMGGALPWWRQMDSCRENAGLRPRMRARVGEDGVPALKPDGTPELYDSTVYYEHIILSPDPADSPTLGQVRSVALAWAAEQFPGFQVAIGYHGDTDVPHAHVIVNGVDVNGERRVTDVTRGQWCRRAWARLQEIARENGLSGFSQQGGEDAEERLEREMREYEAARSREDANREKDVAEMRERGAYSWVEDIRSRAECAARLSSSTEQYRRALAALRVTVTRAKSGGWLYTLEGDERRRVTGRRLGARWTERGVAARLEDDARRRVLKPCAECFEGVCGVLAPLMSEASARVDFVAALERPDGPEGRQRMVDEVAEMLSWLDRLGVASVAELDALRGLSEREGRMAGLARALGCLPQERPVPPWAAAQERAGGPEGPAARDGRPQRGAAGEAPAPESLVGETFAGEGLAGETFAGEGLADGGAAPGGAHNSGGRGGGAARTPDERSMR